MRILLLEDDADLGELLVLGLRNAAYATDLAQTCAAAQELLLTTNYDVACIDLGLPDGDGLDLIGSLGPGSIYERPTRIIVLTARDDVEQRIAGLDAGADDYLVKPFAFDELLARVRAVSGRSDQSSSSLTVGNITIDLAAQQTWRAGTEIVLTAREFALLRYFMHHPGRVLSAEDLLEHVWDANADPFTTTVRVILSRLRKKLGVPNPIETVEGAGYRLEDL